MAKRIQSVSFGVLGGTLLLYALSRDFVTLVSAARSLWWFVLEVVVLAAVIATIVLLNKTLPPADLEAIKGVRAVVGVAMVLVAFVPAMAAGVYLDSLLGLTLSFGVILAVVAMDISLRLVGMFLSKRAPATHGLYPAVESSELPPDSTPPN